MSYVKLNAIFNHIGKQPNNSTKGGKFAKPLLWYADNVQYLLDLTALVSAHLPPNVTWMVTSYQNNTLGLATPDATAASRVKYLRKQYIKQFLMLEPLKDLKYINVIVMTQPVEKNRQIKRLQPISEASKQHLAQMANVVGDDDLKACFIRLSQL